MSTQPSLFDPAEAERKRRSGIRRVSGANEAFLILARLEARRICRQRGTVVMDDVRASLERRGIKPTHHNAWGAVFAVSEFEWTGDFWRSALVQGKGNMQRVWRLRL